MNTIYDLKELANQLLEKTYTFSAKGLIHSVSPKHNLNYIFTFDNAKRRLGRCNYTNRIISMSRPICLENLDKINGKLTDTILHEIAHALCVYAYGIVDGCGHVQNWVNIAKQIGCDGERCYDSDVVIPTKSKYTLVCPNCPRETPKHRKPKRTYSCSNCSGGRFNPLFIMTLKQNF